MFRKNYTNQEIADGILNFDPKIYLYLDAVYCKKTIKYVLKNFGSEQNGENHFQNVVCEIYLNIKHGRYNPDNGSFESYFIGVVRESWTDILHRRN